MTRDRSRRAVTRTSVLVTALLCVTGCAWSGPDAGAARDAAERFHAAVAAADGETACALLVPAAAEELEDTAGAPCARAVLDADLPEVSGALTTHAWGRGAQVVLDGDTIFLTVSGRDWLVSAAGCTPRPERPYDCEITGA